MFKSFFSLLLICCAAFCCCGQSVYLIPSPKKAVFSKPFTVDGKNFKITDRSGKSISAEQLAFFSRTLNERLGWQENKNAKNMILLEKIPANRYGSEYYELDVKPGKIRIAASGKAGIMRGVSRFLAMTNTPLLKADAGKIIMTGVTIRDYPDNAERIFQINLRQVFDHTPKKLLMDTAFMLIDRAAELQFNCVMPVIGGSMKLEGHPEINPPGPVFSKEEIRAMVERAKLRGMVCAPLINSIGHASAAPWICPLYDRDGKKVIGINVTDPAFDKLFFRYIDELAGLFPGAPVFGIGTDEFHRVMAQIAKLSGKKCEEYYPEYVNKVSRHLKKYGMRTMIYHDMMGPGGRYKWPVETLNGPKGAMEMLKKFDKDVIVGYWNYFHAHDYPFVKDLRAAGFKTIWMTGWYGKEGIGALYALGNKLKQPLFTTHWSAIPAKNEFIHGSEFSWNAKSSKNQDDFNDINNIFFYGRPQGNMLDSVVETVKLQGGFPVFREQAQKLNARFPGGKTVSSGVPADFSSARSFTAKLPVLKTVPLEMIPELHKKNELKNYVLFTDNSIEQRIIGKRSGVNEKREKGKMIFYTPAHGSSTGTNNRGVEFAVDGKGKIVELSGNCTGRSGDEKGNMKIPAGGMVISWNEAQPCFFFRSYTFYQTLRKNDQLKLMKRNMRGLLRSPVSGKFSAPRRGAAVFLQAVNPMEPGRVARICFRFAGGSKKYVTVKGSDFISAPCVLRDLPEHDLWTVAPMVRYGMKPLLAVEWNCGKNSSLLTGVEIQPYSAGADAGLCVLGVTAFGE